MNAKEISDATLESVTPADDDLMILYDVSEGTTGKATIADIAPKVAENIDISTLPAVTPAADDVLMIGDTSEGTTGKATIADIAPKVAENINIIDGTLTYSPMNADGISEVFAKKYGRIAQIHANISNCNLVGGELTEIAITNLIPLNKNWQLVYVDSYVENLSPRCFLTSNGRILLMANKSITLNIRIDCIFMCE